MNQHVTPLVALHEDYPHSDHIATATATSNSIVRPKGDIPSLSTTVRHGCPATRALAVVLESTRPMDTMVGNGVVPSKTTVRCPATRALESIRAGDTMMGSGHPNKRRRLTAMPTTSITSMPLSSFNLKLPKGLGLPKLTPESTASNGNEEDESETDLVFPSLLLPSSPCPCSTDAPTTIEEKTHSHQSPPSSSPPISPVGILQSTLESTLEVVERIPAPATTSTISTTATRLSQLDLEHHHHHHDHHEHHHHGLVRSRTIRCGKSRTSSSLCALLRNSWASPTSS